VTGRARRRLGPAALVAALALAGAGPAATAPAAPPPASAAECAAWGSRVDRLTARIRAAVAVSRRAESARTRAGALTVARRLARERAGYRALVAAGCGVSPAPPVPPARGASGIEGTLVISPSTPVCVVGRPCSAPAPGVTLVFERAGQAVATTVTGTGGEYRVALPSGPYTVRAPGASVGGGIQVAGGSGDEVVVPEGIYARVDLTLDVGIR
jgi:hypothetical protein